MKMGSRHFLQWYIVVAVSSIRLIAFSRSNSYVVLPCSMCTHTINGCAIAIFQSFQYLQWLARKYCFHQKHWKWNVCICDSWASRTKCVPIHCLYHQHSMLFKFECVSCVFISPTMDGESRMVLLLPSWQEWIVSGQIKHDKQQFECLHCRHTEFKIMYRMRTHEYNT